MPDDRSAPFWTRRLAVYSYLRPLFAGRRVLEVGCGRGYGAAHLLHLGAASVTGVDGGGPISEAQGLARATNLNFVEASPATWGKLGPFDVVLVPEAQSLFTRPGDFGWPALRSALGPAGHLICVTPNGDRPQARDGVGYHDLYEALAPNFPRVRMFGQTPFAAFGIAEFEEATAALRVESDLVSQAEEQPTHYVAIAGPEGGIPLGYALVQVPSLAGAQVPAIPRATFATPSGDSAEISRKLAETEGRLDGALRVGRAQVEELEELRARLRRAAQSRAELDDEMTRLRRALTEADESVLSLTRKTTEEMTALAQRLTAGLRGGVLDAGSGDRGRHEAELAARESALSERDERIAGLEAEKQDLLWRVESSEEQLRRAKERPVDRGASRNAGTDRSPAQDELLATLRAREQAIDEFRRAAAVHVDEVARLRDALNEQSTLVVELEEALAEAESKRAALEQEGDRVRRAMAEAEASDRARRSRLAELEGTLLRLQRQQAMAEAERRLPPPAVQQGGDDPRLVARLDELELQSNNLHQKLRDADRMRAEAESRWSDAADRIVGLEREAAERERLVESQEALYARISELQERPDPGRLESAFGEVARLRRALEKSEEQLWESRGQVLAERQRIEGLERQIVTASTPSSNERNYQAFVQKVLDEVAVLEQGLRAEIGQIASVEQILSEWRTALATNGSTAELSSPHES